MKTIIEQLRAKIKACSDTSKESRARKGAYVDCLVMLEEFQEDKVSCPECGAPCTMSYSGLDLVANTGDETLADKHYHFNT